MEIESLLHFVAENPLVIYGAIFVAMFFEGEAVILLTSIIAWQGYLRWDLLTATLLLGAYTGNLLWYELGKHIQGTRLGGWFKGRTSRLIGWIDRIVLERYPSFAILSKFLYGTNHATLFLVGWNRYPFKKFLLINLYANIIWVSTILISGFFLGFAVDSIGFKKAIHRIELLIIGIILVTYLIGALLKKLFRRELKVLN